MVPRPFPLCFLQQPEESKEPRQLRCNAREPNAHFPNNYIRTTNYTLLTFLPLDLLQQFRKMSNIFFLINMVIALIPGVSPVFPATTIIPLIVVVGSAMLRDAYEDFQRYQSDRRANALKVKMVTPSGAVQSIESSQVSVGDVLYLERGTEIPADCLLISSAMEDGACFVETAQLDGETNMKPKQCKDILHKRFGSPQLITGFSGAITCDPPGVSMHKWLGKIACPDVPEQSVDMDNFLLRGCIVRNVDWVMAVTVYTGIDTRLFRNLVKTPPKVSRLDQKLNKLILVILGVQQLIIVLISSLQLAWLDRPAGEAFYLKDVEYDNGATTWVMGYLTYFILLSTMMPISLFVSLEFCKTVQAKLIDWDEEMIGKIGGKDGSPKARTSSLNEELSQVQYIFSDKTGTLTDNEMRFARCFAGDRPFDELDTQGNLLKFLEASRDVMAKEEVLNFLRLMTFCNTVIINTAPNGTLSYDGSSTDEVALVGAAVNNGDTLLSRTSDTMTVSIQGVISTVDVDTIMPFTPERKMMSVVLRERDGTIRMYTKGADSGVMARLAPPVTPRDVQQRKNAQAFLDECANIGLRTLACGERIFSPEEYAVWKKQWDEACLTTTDDRDEKVHVAALEAEKGMTFVGCTAIEDKLQIQVPETINFILNCGIILWVLTGDKRETAVNIAGTSRLVDPKEDLLVHIDIELPTPIPQQLSEAINQIDAARQRNQKATFIVDGKSLEVILEPSTYPLFKELGLKATSAVCCRVTPLQKSRVVKMFKEEGFTCLAVGDGANDVSMIQEARVGIGILGLEGSQAERAADYAIPRFMHLRRLLAVHGRYSLVRNSNLIQYSFYKNIVYGLTQVFFAFYNGFSGQTVYDSWVVLFFNIFFTFLPPMVMGIFDFDVKASYLLEHPGLFAELRSPFAIRMSRASSFLWMVLALFHATIIFYGCYRGAMQNDIVKDGREGGLWVSATTMMSTMLCVVTFQAALSFLSWTYVHLASILLSFLAYVLFIFIYESLPPSLDLADYYKVSSHTHETAAYWLNVLLWVGLFSFPQVAVAVIRRSWFGIHMHKARLNGYLTKKLPPWQSSPSSAAMALGGGGGAVGARLGSPVAPQYGQDGSGHEQRLLAVSEDLASGKVGGLGPHGGGIQYGYGADVRSGALSPQRPTKSVTIHPIPIDSGDL